MTWVKKAFPDGHYYSAIPDLTDIEARAQQIFAQPDALPGIDLRHEEQLALVDRLAEEAKAVPFQDDPDGQVRYGWKNEFFGAADALAWWGLLRLRRPARVLEVGSGWSSAVLLDAIDHTDGWDPDVTFVEPYPDRLKELVREDDDAKLWQCGVQDASRELFDELEAGDVLFIDSTHVSKVGSDVNLLLLDIVPSLAPGVLVHVHDILYPFEYPADWVFDGRAWTETYVLRALLANSASLRIVWWNDMMMAFHQDTVAAAMPKWAEAGGGSIYLETF